MASNYKHDEDDLFADLDLEEEFLTLDGFDVEDGASPLKLEQDDGGEEDWAAAISSAPQGRSGGSRTQSRKKSGAGKKVLVVLLIVVALAAVAVGGWAVWTHFHSSNDPASTGESTPPTTESVPAESQPAESIPAETQSAETNPAEEELDTEAPQVAPVETDNQAWNLRLVNEANPMSAETEASLSLVNVNAKGVEQAQSDFLVDSRIVQSLESMIADCCAATGGSLRLSSAYRSIAQQQEIWDRNVASLGSEEAALASQISRPGCSDLHTGLTVRMCARDEDGNEIDFASSNEAAWLTEHAWEYGFILRYPQEKKDFTGMDGIATLYRYVGEDAAQAIVSNGWCLEEYLLLSSQSDAVTSADSTDAGTN